MTFQVTDDSEATNTFVVYMYVQDGTVELGHHCCLPILFPKNRTGTEVTIRHEISPTFAKVGDETPQTQI